jgi:hypothetical protein
MSQLMAKAMNSSSSQNNFLAEQVNEVLIGYFQNHAYSHVRKFYDDAIKDFKSVYDNDIQKAKDRYRKN